MKHIKKIIIVFMILIFIIILYVLFIAFNAAQFAVKDYQLPHDKKYILCQIVKTTGFDWIVIGDQDGRFDKQEYIRVTGRDPTKILKFGMEYGDNTYVFFGEYRSEGVFDTDNYRTFHIESWDVLYPIKRNSLFSFLLPRNIVTKFDVRLIAENE